MKCYNSDCTFEGSMQECRSHAAYCTHESETRFCSCYACEGHREGKRAARELDAQAAETLAWARQHPDDRAMPFVRQIAGRFMRGVLR